MKLKHSLVPAALFKGPSAQAQKGWKNLFNGKDLTGRKQLNGKLMNVLNTSYYTRYFKGDRMSSQVNQVSVANARNGLFSKFRGGELPLPPKPAAKAVFLAWLGGVIAISVVASITSLVAMPLVLGSFGATCVLVFGYPDVPFSQPRNIVFGHLLSSFIGLIFLAVFGPHWWAAGLATGTAIAVMMVTRTVHPPAGSNPVIVFLSQPGWGFLLYPTLVGALIIMIVATLYNNATRPSNYPKYW